MTDRMVPYFCPYCGDEDLRPSEAGHGTWECRSCARAFSVKFVGLLRPPASSTASSAPISSAPIVEEARS